MFPKGGCPKRPSFFFFADPARPRNLITHRDVGRDRPVEEEAP